MPWLAAALAALRALPGRVASGPAGAVARRVAGPFGWGAGGYVVGNALLGGEGGIRRRRRRRTLTASDRADIAFIAGMISKNAAKDFATMLAAKRV